MHFDLFQTSWDTSIAFRRHMAKTRSKFLETSGGDLYDPPTVVFSDAYGILFSHLAFQLANQQHRGKMLGAVIGKAMGSLDSSRGIIQVLVALQ